MSSIQNSRDWLGTSGDWGLTRKKHGELCAELSDHVTEMARVESHGAAQDAKETLSQPKVRRRLAGVHLADQVYATLNRLPDKKEWRELMWLGVWYLMILGADALSLLPEKLAGSYPWERMQSVASTQVIAIVTAAWLLQAAARVGFFISFINCLVNAGKIGWGVLIARILQLKLIHTLLVVIAHMLLGQGLWEGTPYYSGFVTPWPLWLTAPVVSGGFMLVAMVVLFFAKSRYRLVGIGLAMSSVLLFVGGPYKLVNIKVTRPLSSNTEKLEDGTLVRHASTDQAIIDARAKKLFERQEQSSRFYSLIDAENNQIQFETFEIVHQIGHFTGEFDNGWGKPDYKKTRWRESEDYPVDIQIISASIMSPVAAPGAGLGWLAVPIPFLGVIGLVSLVCLMGRRGIFEFFAYGIICCLGILSTLMPFMVRSNSPAVLFNSKGLLHSPFPGFEALMSNPQFGDYLWLTLVGCLVFSAGIPWLLTSLFLKPGHSEQQIDDGDKMQEAGS